VPSPRSVGQEQATLESPNLGKLLRLQYPFVIPDYQRPFSWQAQQVEDFVTDLFTHYGSIPVRGTTGVEPYFFGAIITLERKTGRGSDDRLYEVVDGQQRLTAFYLTVAEIRRRLGPFEAEAKAGGNSRIKRDAKKEFQTMDTRLYDGEASQTTPRNLRLTPAGVDKAFYAKLMTDGDTSALLTSSDPISHHRLFDAVDGIRDELVSKVVGSGSLGDRFSRLKRLADALLEHSYVIHASSTSDAEAYRLFQSLNDRGSPLTDADLLRTKTLEVLRDYDADRKRAADAWDVVVKDEDPRRFLQAYYGIKEGKRPLSVGLHRQYQKQGWVGRKPANAAEARAAADLAVDIADSYAIHTKIAKGTWPYAPHSADDWQRARLTRLIKNTRQISTIPLLVALARGPETRFAAGTAFLDRFALRYVIAKGHPSTAADAYIAEAKLIREDLSRTVKQMCLSLETLARDEADDVRFEGRLKDFEYGKHGPLLRHLLTTLDNYEDWYQAGAKGEPTPSTINVWNLGKGDIDHIYPQNPQSGHRVPALDAICDNLGNLTFLESKENQSARNSPFAVKQVTVYKKTQQPALTRYLSSTTAYPGWDVASVTTRRDEIVKRSLAVLRVY